MKKNKRQYKYDSISLGEAAHHTSLRKTSKTHTSKKKYSRKGKAKWGGSPPSGDNCHKPKHANLSWVEAYPYKYLS